MKQRLWHLNADFEVELAHHATAPGQSFHRACETATSCATSTSFGLSVRYFLYISTDFSRSFTFA